MLACCALLAAMPDLRAADTVEGNLLLQIKGEVEVFHNGRKIVLRDKMEDIQHYGLKVPARSFKAGDVIVLNIRSPYVYRAITAAVNLVKKGGQIPVKQQHWRFLGMDKDARKIAAADILACQDVPAAAAPDGNGEEAREKLGFLPNGSDWVKTKDQLNKWYCMGFVLTQEMLDAPMPAK